MTLHGGGALEQVPAAHEHESNAPIENGVKLLKGILRVLQLALEARISGRIPTSHPIFARIVGHAAAVLSKNLRGKDGRTPYERLFGKTLSEDCLEFGEKLRWKAPREAGYNVLVEPRWFTGVWLGRRWAGPTHFVFDVATKTVHEVRAVQRMPAGERWSLEAV